MAELPSNGVQLSFPNYPQFRPHYTPRQVLELGAFGGSFLELTSLVAKLKVNVYTKLTTGLPHTKYEDLRDANNNFFGVYAVSSPSLVPSEVRVKYPGRFFMWYIMLFYDQELPVLESEMWVNQWQNTVRNLCTYFTVENRSDLEYRKEYRQALLQLGWDSTKPFLG